MYPEAAATVSASSPEPGRQQYEDRGGHSRPRVRINSQTQPIPLLANRGYVSPPPLHQTPPTPISQSPAQKPPLPNHLRAFLHIILPGAFLVLFLITATVVVVYTFGNHEATPAGYLKVVGILFGVVLVLRCIGAAWLSFRKQTKSDRELDADVETRPRCVDPESGGQAPKQNRRWRWWPRAWACCGSRGKEDQDENRGDDELANAWEAKHEAWRDDSDRASRNDSPQPKYPKPNGDLEKKQKKAWEERERQRQQEIREARENARSSRMWARPPSDIPESSHEKDEPGEMPARPLSQIGAGRFQVRFAMMPDYDLDYDLKMLCADISGALRKLDLTLDARDHHRGGADPIKQRSLSVPLESSKPDFRDWQYPSKILSPGQGTALAGEKSRQITSGEMSTSSSSTETMLGMLRSEKRADRSRAPHWGPEAGACNEHTDKPSGDRLDPKCLSRLFLEAGFVSQEPDYRVIPIKTKSAQSDRPAVSTPPCHSIPFPDLAKRDWTTARARSRRQESELQCRAAKVNDHCAEPTTHHMSITKPGQPPTQVPKPPLSPRSTEQSHTATATLTEHSPPVDRSREVCPIVHAAYPPAPSTRSSIAASAQTFATFAVGGESYETRPSSDEASVSGSVQSRGESDAASGRSVEMASRGSRRMSGRARSSSVPQLPALTGSPEAGRGETRAGSAERGRDSEEVVGRRERVRERDWDWDWDWRDLRF